MPVWGDAFRRTRDGLSEEAARARIDALVRYLEAIHERATFLKHQLRCLTHILLLAMTTQSVCVYGLCTMDQAAGCLTSPSEALSRSEP
jgi:hypothetical protein